MQEYTIVTGGNSGIGLAITRRMVAEGSRCAVLARDAERWSNIDDADLHRGAEFVPCDVAEDASIEAALQQVFGRGRVRHLVNCAGINTRVPSVALPTDRWDEILRVNLTAPFVLSRGIAEHMISNGGGSIVNIGSMATTIGIPSVAAYSSAKAGLLQLSKALAVEWATHGIRVNVVNPGYIETALTHDVLAEGPLRDYLDTRIPAGRLTRPHDVAEAVAFLLSERATNITGQVINVDGGITAGEPGLAPR